MDSSIGLSLYVKESVLKTLEESMQKVLHDAVLKLSKEYGFDSESAFRLVGVNVKTKNCDPPKKQDPKDKPKVPLPWTGVIVEKWCHGLKATHGLYNQCNNIPLKNKGHGELYGLLCSTCLKQCETNENGKPNAGLVTDRLMDDFKPENGKSVSRYSSVMTKLKINREDAEAEASKYGLTIPEIEFEMVDKKRGRPQKEVKVSGEPAEKEVKKRGRPQKAKRTVSVVTAEEMLNEIDVPVITASELLDTLEEQRVEVEKASKNKPAKKATKPVAEKPTKPVAEKPTKPVAEKPTTPVAEKPTKPVAEKPTKPVAEKPTKPVAEKPIEAVAEKPTEPVAEEISEPVAEEISEADIEAELEAITKSVVDCYSDDETEAEETEADETEAEETEAEETETEEGEHTDDSDEDTDEMEVVIVMINGVEYYMREEEECKISCEVFDESGEIIGYYNETNKGKPSLSKKKFVPKK